MKYVERFSKNGDLYIRFENNGKVYERKLTYRGRQFSDLVFSFKGKKYFFDVEDNKIEFSEYWTLMK